MGRDIEPFRDVARDIAGGAGDGAKNATADLVGKGVRLAPPWVVGATLPVGAWVCDHFWGSPSAAPVVAMAMTASTGVLTWLVHKLNHARARLGRIHATVTTGACLGYVTVATAVGPGEPVMLAVWGLGGFTLAASWNLRGANRGGAAGDGDPLHALFRQVKEKTGVNAAARTKEIGPDRATADVKMLGGATVADLARELDHIKSLLAVPPNGVRLTPDPSDASRAQLTVVARDVLAEAIPWSGPACAGGLPTDPVRFGTYEDALPAAFTLPGIPEKDKNAYQVGIGGANGMGKSGIPLIVSGEFVCRYETAVWTIDVVKTLQTWGPIAEHLDWLAVDVDQAARMLETLAEEIRARSEYLGQRGFDQWVPGCGLAYLVVNIEEASSLDEVADGDALRLIVKLLQQSRSLGIGFEVSVQRWTHDNVPTSARAEITAGFQFGSDSAADAAYLLGDDLVESGADPSPWKAAGIPGRCYFRANEVPADRQRMAVRVHKARPADVGRLVAGKTIPPGTAAGGRQLPICLADTEAYRSRPLWVRRADGTLEQASRDTSAQTHVSAPATGWTPPSVDPDAPFRPAPDDDPDVVCGIDDEFPPLPDMQFPRPAVAKVPPAEALAALVAFVGDRRQRRQRFTPKDLVPLYTSLGYSRSWAQGELKTMVEAGDLAHVGYGEYSAHEIPAHAGT